MRSGELRTLRRDGLDLARGTATVLGKGARQRAVLLPPALVPTLVAFLDQVRPRLPASPLLLANAHPFVTTAEHGFGTDALAREVELAGVGAGVSGRHYPHKWRHTFATELVRAGVDIHVVQRLLGHRHIASTVGYTHLALDDLRTAVGDLWGAA
jgi:site-specific recombinase XerD